MRPTGEGSLRGNITKNLKTIEWLKTELVDGIASLFKAMIPNQEKKLVNSLVRLIITSFVLGRRLGISYERMDDELKTQLHDLIDSGHEVEEWFGDLSELQKHMDNRKRF